MSLGGRIKEARLEKGIKQKELAKTLHMTQAAVSAWETGKRVPPYDIIKLIAKTLDCDINYLFEWDE